jgi:hypothetical protein
MSRRHLGGILIAVRGAVREETRAIDDRRRRRCSKESRYPNRKHELTLALARLDSVKEVLWYRP